MNYENKVTVLTLISENKNVLFGKCDSKVTFDMKVQKWKEIAQQLHEMGIFHKDWKYLRDTTWQNWRKRAIDKWNNHRESGKKGKLDVVDNIIINMLGKNTDLNNLDVPELYKSKYSIELPNMMDNMHNTMDNMHNMIDNMHNMTDNMHNMTDTMHNLTDNMHNMMDNMHNMTDISNNSTEEDANYANNMYFKSMKRLRKAKMEADIILTKHQIEIAKRKKYKLDLELLKLEKELNIRKVSSFTLPYNTAEENTVIPENVGQHFSVKTEDHL